MTAQQAAVLIQILHGIGEGLAGIFTVLCVIAFEIFIFGVKR
jgi:hypothetical protein